MGHGWRRADPDRPALRRQPRFRRPIGRLLGGGTSQRRWEDATGDLKVLWVGVRCDAAVAAGREIARGDRIAGMAASQADAVHQGVKYDLEVDTTHAEAIDCAGTIALHVK
ncbi:MAG TPA: hypothetical protein VFT31_16015 [Kribbella sp.]|nr:hypothetical protein [Kribbella sp.]